MAQPDNEILWKQYALHVDLYKHYLDITLKFSVFNYAVTGAILSFFSTSKADQLLLKWALAFPILMNVFFGLFFLWASTLIGVVRQEVANLASALGLRVFPEVGVLVPLLRMFGILYLLTGFGISCVLGRAVLAAACA